MRAAWIWTTIACGIASTAYHVNRPGWFGKRDGRLTLQSVPVLPYLGAFRIACELMRRWRAPDAPTLVAPGLWVGGRVAANALPAGVTHVVDLIAEFPAPALIRALPGYRSLPVLDGGVPADMVQFLALMAELLAIDGGVLVHCDAGRGRAPTAAAALLIARGDALDATTAVRMIQHHRPVAAPTRSDLAFLAAATPALRALAGSRSSRYPSSTPARSPSAVAFPAAGAPGSP